MSPSVTVVVCTYTDRRWRELRLGVEAVLDQLGTDDELIVVVDHNPDLFDRVRGELLAAESPSRARAVENTGGRGLSGGRNTGVTEATRDVVIFLDDDACPAQGWVDAYRRRFEDDDVVGVGGAISPAWEGGIAPRWFPPEFGWVVGCDYVGLPGDGASIRNPIGASMAVRRKSLDVAGGFSELVGRVDTLPVGCEETELFIRIRQASPGVTVLRDTTARVHHLVPADRQTVRYFFSRCYHEGRSKAVLASTVGTGDSLSSERAYVRSVLPRGAARHLGRGVRGDVGGLGRAAAVPAGLAATVTGYLAVRVHRALRPTSKAV